MHKTGPVLWTHGQLAAPQNGTASMPQEKTGCPRKGRQGKKPRTLLGPGLRFSCAHAHRHSTCQDPSSFLSDSGTDGSAAGSGIAAVVAAVVVAAAIAAAAAVASTAAAASAPAVVSAAAPDNDEQDDNPAAVTSAKAVVTHK